MVVVPWTLIPKNCPKSLYCLCGNSSYEASNRRLRECIYWAKNSLTLSEVNSLSIFNLFSNNYSLFYCILVSEGHLAGETGKETWCLTALGRYGAEGWILGCLEIFTFLFQWEAAAIGNCLYNTTLNSKSGSILSVYSWSTSVMV